MTLSDFLNSAGSIYSDYASSEAASDLASAAQATASGQASVLAQEKERNASLLKWGLIGGGVLLAVVILIVVVKKLK